VPPGVGYPLATPIELNAFAERFGEQVLTIEADVRDREAMESSVDAALVHFGRLDAAVAAAGVVIGGQSQWHTPDDHLRTLIDVNVLGVWNLAAAVIRPCWPEAPPAGAVSSPSAPPRVSEDCSTSPATPPASTQSSASSAASQQTLSAPA